MPSVIETPGAANANSFVSVAEATTYLDARPNIAAWTAADADAKARAVITATRLLSPLSWRGSRVTSTQALSWPRANCPDPDAPTGYLGATRDDWVSYDISIIPQRVKDATCETALAIVNSGATDFATLDADANLTSKTVGPLSKSWGAGGKPQGLARFPMLSSLLGPLLDVGGVRRS